ncbi:MAG: polyprenyl synthetase family protein [Mycobacteriales bacterium]
MTSTRHRSEPVFIPRPGELEDSPVEREDLRRRVSEALDGFLDRQDARLASMAGEVGEMVLALRDLLSAGKRLRPAFGYWAWRGTGMPDDDRMVVAAAALELFQASAIIHDDVMDSSDTRRGRPTVHRRFGALHRAEGWRSDEEAFGAGAAILVGDLCLGWSDEMFFGCRLAPERLVRARPIFDEMRTELMGGQYLDLLEQALGGGSVARSRRVIQYKSARYSVLRPLQLGAALAGAGRQLRAAYDAYGLPLGEAFQLRDDVLGVFGDPAETGKPAGDDLREGKRTVLVALAVQHGSRAQVRVVDRYLGDPALDIVGMESLRQVLVETGALAEVERMIAASTERALNALAAVEVAPPADRALRELAAAATARRS